MLDANEKQVLNQGMTIIRIIWAAMLLSLGIYLYVCHRLAAQLPAGDNRNILPAMRTALYAVAAVELLVIRHLRRHMLKGGPGADGRTSMRTMPGTAPHPAVGRYTVATVVSLALAESVGIYGMVLFLLGADFRTLYLFMAVSAATMVYYRPTMGEMETLALGMKVNS